MSKKSPKSLLKDYKITYYKCFDFHHKVILKLIQEKEDVNDELIALRISILELLDNYFQEITALLVNNIELKKKAMKSSTSSAKKEYNIPCNICGENRVINLCHLIPRSEGGHDGNGNLIFLCPTHHFLFDHARLSNEEFEKINTSTMDENAQKYFFEIHKNKHRLRWKYQTNRFKGCTCGSLKFDFVSHRSKIHVSVGLQCKSCDETWLNVWEDLHPISQKTTYVIDKSSYLSGKLEITDEALSLRLDSAEKEIQYFIKYSIPKITNQNPT
ncbi:MAG: HNH endonuclease [Flavobacteriales bacterium]|nr:HNH endonuclease [Flavobacteriales bacterium]